MQGRVSQLKQELQHPVQQKTDSTTSKFEDLASPLGYRVLHPPAVHNKCRAGQKEGAAA